ncbi:MAG: hypothetical protein ACT4OK_17375 [Gemmobacter sp.]
MTDYRIDPKPFVAAAKKAPMEDKELDRLIQNLGSQLENMQRWLEQLKLFHRDGVKNSRVIKRMVSEFYAQADEKLKDKSLDPAKKKALRDLRQSAGEARSEAEKIGKLFTR